MGRKELGWVGCKANKKNRKGKDPAYIAQPTESRKIYISYFKELSSLRKWKIKITYLSKGCVLKSRGGRSKTSGKEYKSIQEFRKPG